LTQSNSNPWSKSGVIIREATNANARFVGIYVTPSNGVSMQFRGTTGAGATDFARTTGLIAPRWVRLVRSGNSFTGFQSADGVTWVQVGTNSASVTMSSAVVAGLA